MSAPKFRVCKTKHGDQLVFELPLKLNVDRLCRDLLAHDQIGEATREDIEDQNSQRHMASLDMVRPPELRWEVARGERKIKMGSGCASFTVAISIDLSPLCASQPDEARQEGWKSQARQEGWKSPARQEGREGHQKDFRMSREGWKAYLQSVDAARDDPQTTSSSGVVPEKRTKRIANQRLHRYPLILPAGEDEKDPTPIELNALEEGMSYAEMHLLVRDLLKVPRNGPQSLRLTFKNGNVVPSRSDHGPCLEDLAGKVLVAQVLR